MILAMLTGCILDATVGGCGDAGACEQVERFEQTMSLDLLLVIDGSPSMADDHQRLSEALPALVAPLVQPAFDVHLGVLSMDMTLAPGVLQQVDGRRWADASQGEQAASAWLASAALVPTTSGADERGLGAVVAALADSAPAEDAGFRRASAPLSLLFLSDEDDASEVELSSFAELVTAGQPGLLAAHAIVPVDTVCTTVVGDRYVELAARTGGAVLSICEPSHGPFLSAIAQLEALRGRRDNYALAASARPGSVSVTITPPNDEPYLLQPDDFALARDGAELVLRTLPPPPGSELEVRYQTASAL